MRVVLLVSLLLALPLASAAVPGTSIWAMSGTYTASRLVPTVECEGEVVFAVAGAASEKGVATFAFDRCADPPATLVSERVGPFAWRLLLPDGTEVGYVGPGSSEIDGLPFALELPHGSFRGVLGGIIF